MQSFNSLEQFNQMSSENDCNERIFHFLSFISLIIKANRSYHLNTKLVKRYINVSGIFLFNYCIGHAG